MAILAELLPALGLIVGLLLLVRWWSQRGGGGRSRNLQVTARASLSRTANVAVVEIDGRRYLVGGSDSNVSLLTELPGTHPVAAADKVPVVLGMDADSGTGVAADDFPAATGDAPLADLASALPKELEGLELTPAGPRNGLVDRLRAMTARTAIGRPPRGASPLSFLQR